MLHPLLRNLTARTTLPVTTIPPSVRQRAPHGQCTHFIAFALRPNQPMATCPGSQQLVAPPAKVTRSMQYDIFPDREQYLVLSPRPSPSIDILSFMVGHVISLSQHPPSSAHVPIMYPSRPALSAIILSMFQILAIVAQRSSECLLWHCVDAKGPLQAHLND